MLGRSAADAPVEPARAPRDVRRGVLGIAGPPAASGRPTLTSGRPLRPPAIRGQVPDGSTDRPVRDEPAGGDPPADRVHEGDQAAAGQHHPLVDVVHHQGRPPAGSPRSPASPASCRWRRPGRAAGPAPRPAARSSTSPSCCRRRSAPRRPARSTSGNQRDHRRAEVGQAVQRHGQRQARAAARTGGSAPGASPAARPARPRRVPRRAGRCRARRRRTRRRAAGTRSARRCRGPTADFTVTSASTRGRCPM